MFGLSKIHLSAILILLIIFGSATYVDFAKRSAVKNREAEIDSEHKDSRIKNIKEAKELEDEIQDLDDATRRYELCVILRGKEECEPVD